LIYLILKYMARSITSLGNQSSSSEGLANAQRAFVPQAPGRGVHLTGLPRYRHANANGAAFVFDGCATSEADFTAMSLQQSTYLVATGFRENGGRQDHAYKRQTMVQEEGAVAAERRGLQDEAVDQLYRLLRERDRALDLRDAQEVTVDATTRRALSLGPGGLSSAAAADPPLLQLDGARIAARLAREAAVVEAARVVLRARHAKGFGDPSWREVAARKDAVARSAAAAHARAQRTQVPMNRQASALSHPAPGSRGSSLLVQDERALMRFLKEGPRDGDGAYEPTPGAREARSARAALSRTHQLQVTQAMWRRPPEQPRSQGSPAPSSGGD
jgi:hypothetical protein